jgi:1,4-dihydroxy-2-naphthoate octaprenyltransferase
MTVVSVSIGTLAAGAFRVIHWGLALATLAGTLCLHAATNLANDYFDYEGGIDSPDAPGVRARHHPIVEKVLLPRHVLAGAFAFWIAAALIGTAVGIARGWPLILLTVLGVAAGFSYSAGPLRLKGRALGELTAFLMWGPAMVLGAFFVQRTAFTGSRQALLLSVIQGIWVAQVLLANNLRDREIDLALGVRTPATLMGTGSARLLAVALSAATYVLTVTEVLCGVLRPWALLVFLSAPLTLRLLLSFYAPDGVPGRAPAQAAQTAMVFGALLVLSQVLSRFQPA